MHTIFHGIALFIDLDKYGKDDQAEEEEEEEE